MRPQAFLRAALAALTCLLVWQALVVLTQVPPFLLPPPRAVAEAFWSHRALLAKHALWSSGNLLGGLALGLFLGVETALLLTLSPCARWLFRPLLIGAQAVPVFALAPLLTLWLGYGSASKLATIALVTYFPIASALYDRLMALPPGLHDLSQLCGASRLREVLLLRLPHAVPGLISGLRLAVVYGPLGVLIGEWVGAARGLGHLMLLANGRGQTALMFAAIAVLACLSLLLWAAVEALARRAAIRGYGG